MQHFVGLLAFGVLIFFCSLLFVKKPDKEHSFLIIYAHDKISLFIQKSTVLCAVSTGMSRLTEYYKLEIESCFFLK
jgi:hypothetical protein